MKYTPFVFPDWINGFVPDDSLFARAYQNIPDANRALMKTGIARLYDWYGPRKDIGCEISRRWGTGFDSKYRFDAVDFAVVLFDDNMLSPARCLAALVPAIAGGVQSILAVRVDGGGPWREAILTGLELAGQELVVDLSEVQAKRLLGELRDSGKNGAVTVLGPKAANVQTSEMHAASRIAFWRPRFTRTAAVWMDDDSTFDLEALAFVHPDITFSVFGVDVSLPAENFSYHGDSFENFLKVNMDVAYLSAMLADQALGKAKLVLGPGQEGCWLWPDLHPELFQYHCTSWTIGD